MSAKEWGAVFLAEALASPILLVAALIVGGVLFFAAYFALASLGLVSAVILGLVGWLVVSMIGSFNRKALENHWWIVLIIPAFFVLGFVADRTNYFSLMSWLDSGVVLTSMDWMGSSYLVTVGPWLVGTVALAVAVIVLAVMVVKIKRKYWWVK